MIFIGFLVGIFVGVKLADWSVVKCSEEDFKSLIENYIKRRNM